MAFEPVLIELWPGAVLVDDDDWVVVNKPAGEGACGQTDGARDRERAESFAEALRGLLGSRMPDLSNGIRGFDPARSGLVVVPRSPRAAAAWQRKDAQGPTFEYLALVDASSLGRDKRRLRGAQGVDVSVVERSQGTGLVRVRSRLADGAEVRSLLARDGLPVLGDTRARARPARRVMFHLEGVQLPHMRFPRAPTPGDFLQRVARSGTVRREALESQVFEAMWRRRSLAQRNDAYRFVNDAGDGLPGITVDRYGDWAVLSIAQDLGVDGEQWLADLLMRFGARGVYVKRRIRSDLRRCDVVSLAPAAPLAGEAAPSELVVNEGELRILVALSEGLSCGLFLDQRENRAQLLRRVRPQERMLNLFAYTCSFSVAAAKAGATTTSVDLAAPALAWARRNFELNGLASSAHEFFKADASRWLEGARRHGRRYNWVVLDPPSFSTGGRGSTFSVEKNYCELASAAVSLLEPGGHLLAVTNHRRTTTTRLSEWVRHAASSVGRRITSLEVPPPPIDCPGTYDTPIPSKNLWARVE